MQQNSIFYRLFSVLTYYAEELVKMILTCFLVLAKTILNLKSMELRLAEISCLIYCDSMDY